MKVKIESMVYSLPEIEIELTKTDLGNLVRDNKLETSLEYYEKPFESDLSYQDTGKRFQKVSIVVK